MTPGLKSSTRNWDANLGRTPSWEWVSAASKYVNFGLWTFAPQISTPRFTDPQIQVWYIQGKDVQLKFRDAVLKPKFDWAKAMMAAAPDLPEYVYAYINTRKGPAPEKALNPPFFVEKDRVNFFIIPKNDETEEPSSEEEKKPLQDQTQTTAAK